MSHSFVGLTGFALQPLFLIRWCVRFDMMSKASCHPAQVTALAMLLVQIVQVGVTDHLRTSDQLIKSTHAATPACGAVQLYNIA